MNGERRAKNWHIFYRLLYMHLKAFSKKFIIILSALLLLVAGGYIYIRYHFLKAKNFKPDNSKAKSILDLRPAIIAKLQQVVKDGSNGLYILSVQKLDIDVKASKLDAVNASITVDTAAMLQLEKLKKLPDDIFKMKFATLHIDGLGIEDLINKKHLSINAIYCNDPVIEVFHKNQPYNAAERKANDSLSFYGRIKGQTKSIQIGKINIGRGSFIDHNRNKKNRVSRFNVVSIIMKDLLIDSVTQYDNKRFLFTKYTAIECNNYFFRTPDSLYFFKAGSIHVSGEKHQIIVKDVELKPRGDKQQFERKLKARQVMYHLIFPEVTLRNINWWDMINHERFVAKDAEITHGIFYTYMDETLPPAPFNRDNFPGQILMKLSVPISVKKLTLHHYNVAFEELNGVSKKAATLFFDDVTGTASNISNVASDIKKDRYLTINMKSLFMHKVPLTTRVIFDLAKAHTGAFTADIFMDTLRNTIVNPVAQPLGLFYFKKGEMQSGSAHLDGNDSIIKGTVALRYTDLHIDPLKKNREDTSKLKKKTFTSLFANTFLIKNSNPGKGNDFRKPVFSVNRGDNSNLFSFMWASVLTGILKTIGVPVKAVLK
ncbi:MAG TPA: hypothetical protein VN722_04440 [Hanamia sp.]|nr:hypothetical protein [Hanamia sp.]